MSEPAPATEPAPEAAPAEAAPAAEGDAAPPAEGEAPAAAEAPPAEEPQAPEPPPADASAEVAAAPDPVPSEALVDPVPDALSPAAEEAAAPAPEAPAEPPAEVPAEVPAEADAAAPAKEEAAPAAEADAEKPAEAATPAAEEPAAEVVVTEGDAPEAVAAEGEAPVEAPADAPETEAPAIDAVEEAAAVAADPEAPADAAEAEPEAEAVPEEPKAPTPPPPEPTSAPLELCVEDVTDVSVTINWRPPETIGISGLDGYTVEICKEGTDEWKAANEDLTVSCRYVIKNQTTGDRLNIRVVAVNPGGRSPEAALAESVLVKEVGERPKVRLPRYLRQRYVASVGAKINLTIPFTGKPKPVVSWTKDGEPLDTKRVNIRSTDRDSILFIRTAERPDSGVYEMCVKVESFEDKMPITLQIVELPGPPASVKIVDTWGFNVALEWTPPKDNGNTEITGYTIQKADKKTGDWFTVVEHYHRTNATVGDLIMGNTYSFRVFSENKCGMSEESTSAAETATIVKTGISYKPPEYKEHDFSEPPKFTTDMTDRVTTKGYSTKLLCSVRGFPKPKVEWLKNMIPLANDPKFRMICVQGICTLEIRKPMEFDRGVYACRAKNEHGEALVSCKLEVKQPVDPNAPAEEKED